MEKLQNIIENGILTDLSKAEEAISVFRTIANYATFINTSNQFIISTFAYYQQLSFNEFVLAINRVYDRKTQRNSTRCIEAAIKYLKANKLKIPTVIEKDQLSFEMREYKMPVYLINLINDTDSSVFSLKLIMYYENRLINIRENLKDLKSARDKILAHNESNIVTNINWNKVETLLNFGWQFVVILGWAFFSLDYGTSNDISLRRESQSKGFHVKQVLMELLKIDID